MNVEAGDAVYDEEKFLLAFLISTKLNQAPNLVIYIQPSSQRPFLG